MDVQQRTRIGLLRVIHILGCQELLKEVGPQHQIGCSSLKFKHYLRSCITSGKLLLILYVQKPMENHKGPTPKIKSHQVERITLIGG